MTRLFTTAGGIAVDRLFDAHRSSEINKVVTDNVSRLSSMPKELDEGGLVAERAAIEACSSSGKTYLYSSHWSDGAKQELVEYAAICGCKAAAIDPESDVVKAAVKPAIVKEASATPRDAAKPAAKGLDIGDVFGIDKKGDTSHLAMTKWEQLTAESKLGKPDVMLHRAGAVLPLGGGETYEKSPHLRVKPGQNSVTAPDAIGDMLKDKGEDIGTSLRRQNAERKAIHEAGVKEKDEALAGKMAKDKDYGAYSNRHVHMTESMVAQPGIREGKIMAGAFQKSVADMPARTQGEQLAEQAGQRKAGIQRQASVSKPEFRAMGASRHASLGIDLKAGKWTEKKVPAKLDLPPVTAKARDKVEMTGTAEPAPNSNPVIEKDHASKGKRTSGLVAKDAKTIIYFINRMLTGLDNPSEFIRKALEDVKQTGQKIPFPITEENVGKLLMRGRIKMAENITDQCNLPKYSEYLRDPSLSNANLYSLLKHLKEVFENLLYTFEHNNQLPPGYKNDGMWSPNKV